MRLRPLQDRVLIRRVEPEAMTSGGIFIPDTAQEKPTEVKSSLLDPACAMKPENCTPLMSRSETASCSGSGLVPK